MEDVIKNATLLLQNGEPEEALLLLNEHVYSSPQIEQLRFNCKKQLSTQYLWALNDAVKNGRMDEVCKYVTRYKHLIGYDANIARYDEMLKTTAPQPVTNRLQPILKEATLRTSDFALIPVVFLLLNTLINVFWGKLSEWDLLEQWTYELELEGSWIILIYVSTIFNMLYILSATFVLGTIKGGRAKGLSLETICLYVWSGLWLFACISDMICGFNYENDTFVLALNVCLVVASLLLIIFLVRRITDNFDLRIPLILSIFGTGLLLISHGLRFYAGYIQNQETYSYKSLEVCNSIIRTLFYGYTGMMVISFILLFIVSQRTKSKK